MDLWKFLKQQCLSQSCCCCGVPVAPNLSGCIILTVGLGGWSVAAAFHSTNDCHRGEASCTIGMADWAGMQGVLHGIVLAVVLTVIRRACVCFAWPKDFIQVNPDEDHYDYLDRRNLVGHFLFAFWSFTCCACGWFGALGYNMRLLGLYFFYFTSTSGLLLYRMFSVYFHIPDMCTQWSDESRVLTDMSDDDAYHTDIDDCIDDCRSTMRWVIGLCALVSHVLN